MVAVPWAGTVTLAMVRVCKSWSVSLARTLMGLSVLFLATVAVSSTAVGVEQQ